MTRDRGEFYRSWVGVGRDDAWSHRLLRWHLAPGGFSRQMLDVLVRSTGQSNRAPG